MIYEEMEKVQQEEIQGEFCPTLMMGVIRESDTRLSNMSTTSFYIQTQMEHPQMLVPKAVLDQSHRIPRDLCVSSLETLQA